MATWPALDLDLVWQWPLVAVVTSDYDIGGNGGLHWTVGLGLVCCHSPSLMSESQSHDQVTSPTQSHCHLTQQNKILFFIHKPA